MNTYPCYFLCAVVSLAGVAVSMADGEIIDGNLGYGVYEDVYAPDFEMGGSWNLFEAKEFFIDGFYSLRDFDDTGARSGGGMGLGYYFTRFCGSMVEVAGVNGGSGENLAAAASMLFRLPVDHAAFALYGLVGAGYSFGGVEQWDLEIGGGVDVRLLDQLSSFADVRYVEPDQGEGGASMRVGLRHLF